MKESITSFTVNYRITQTINRYFKFDRLYSNEKANRKKFLSV